MRRCRWYAAEVLVGGTRPAGRVVEFRALALWVVNALAPQRTGAVGCDTRSLGRTHTRPSPLRPGIDRKASRGDPIHVV